MDNVIDLRMIRYLIEEFGLPVAEALQIDIAIAAEYGLVPAPNLPPAPNDGRSGQPRLVTAPVWRARA